MRVQNNNISLKMGDTRKGFDQLKPSIKSSKHPQHIMKLHSTENVYNSTFRYCANLDMKNLN